MLSRVFAWRDRAAAAGASVRAREAVFLGGDVHMAGVTRIARVPAHAHAQPVDAKSKAGARANAHALQLTSSPVSNDPDAMHSVTRPCTVYDKLACNAT